MDTTTVEWLKRHNATKDILKFFQRNKLESFPVDRLDDIEGGFEYFIGYIKFQLKYAIEYDEQGNLIKVGKGGDVTEYTYNQTGKLTKEVRTQGDNVYQWEYDEHGNKTKMVLPDGIIHQWEHEYEYDTCGNLIRDHSGEYEYDEYGNLTKDITSGGLVVYHFEYDNIGNKIKEIYLGGHHADEWKYTHYDNGQLKYIHENGQQILYIPKIEVDN